MPGKILSVKLRYVNLGTDQIREYSKRPSLASYFDQRPPHTLPLLVENDYLRVQFAQFASQEIRSNGYDPESISLRMAIVDIELEAIGRQISPLSFPFMINSVFSYNGLRIHGPFVAGHQAGLSMVQSRAEPRYARYVLPEEYTPFFNSASQTRVIGESVAGILSSPGVDGLIAALPDRRRSAADYGQSNIARVLTGGRIDDVVTGRPFFARWKLNPLCGTPFKICEGLFRLRGESPPAFYDDFTYYSFLRPEYSDLLADADFIRLLNLLRNLGPKYKSLFPEVSEGLLFNPDKNLVVMCGLLQRSLYGHVTEDQSRLSFL